MKIWLTGASGSLGQDLKNDLHQRLPKIEILCPSRFQLDLENPMRVKAFVKAHRPTHVFHLAAKVYGIDGHSNDPSGSLISNTLIDNNVFAAILNYPPEWIYYSSSVAAYGYPYEHLPLMESDWLKSLPHWSEFGYGMAKRHAISYLEILQKKFGSKYVYGLTTNLFGSGDRFNEGKGHVVVSLLHKAIAAKKEGKPLAVWGSGNASRDFLSTSDASRILVSLMDVNAGVVNIASGQEIFIEDIASDVVNVFQIDAGYQFSHVNEGITRRICSIVKLKESLKGLFEVDSRESLRKQVRSFHLKNLT